MAPELVKKTNYYGKDVDKWAQGVLAYRMVTGVYPFRAHTDKDLYRKIITGVYDIRLCPSEDFKGLVSQLQKVNPLERVDLEDQLLHKWFRTNF